MQRMIVVADEDADLVQRIQQTLESQGYAVLTAFTDDQVISLVTSTTPDLLVLGQ